MQTITNTDKLSIWPNKINEIIDTYLSAPSPINDYKVYYEKITEDKPAEYIINLSVLNIEPVYVYVDGVRVEYNSWYYTDYYDIQFLYPLPKDTEIIITQEYPKYTSYKAYTIKKPKVYKIDVTPKNILLNEKTTLNISIESFLNKSKISKGYIKILSNTDKILFVNGNAQKEIIVSDHINGEHIPLTIQFKDDTFKHVYTYETELIIGEPKVKTPEIISPIGTVSRNGVTVVISEFSIYGDYEDAYKGSEWKVCTDILGENVITSGTGNGNVFVLGNIPKEHNKIFFFVRSSGEKYGLSEWAKKQINLE